MDLGLHRPRLSWRWVRLCHQVSDEDNNVALDGLAAWSRGDLESALEGLSPDIEFVTSGAFPGLEPSYRGHDGFRRFWRDFREAWTEIVIDIEQALEPRAGEVLALARFRAVGRDGVSVERPTALRMFVERGRVTQIISYAEWNDALAAAALATGSPSDPRAGR